MSRRRVMSWWTTMAHFSISTRLRNMSPCCAAAALTSAAIKKPIEKGYNRHSQEPACVRQFEEETVMSDVEKIDATATTTETASHPVEYEAPRIERVLTPDEMEREVMFAGPGVA